MSKLVNTQVMRVESLQGLIIEMRLKAKGLNPDFHVAINGNYDKRSPSYYTMESQVNKFTGHEISSNDNKTNVIQR